MSNYVALIEPTDKKIFNTDRASQTIKEGTAGAERYGIKIKNVYWTSGPCKAVLILQAANTERIKGWRDSLKNLRVQIIPAVQDPDTINRTSIDRWRSSCDMIHWWY